MKKYRKTKKLLMGDLGPVFTRIVILHLCPLKCCENWCFSPRPFFVKTHYFRVQTSRISYPHLWTIKLWKNFGNISENKKVINGRPRTSFHSNRHFTLIPLEVLWKLVFFTPAVLRENALFSSADLKNLLPTSMNYKTVKEFRKHIGKQKSY